MKVIQMHDYMTHAPKNAQPNVKALRRIMYSFIAAVAVTCVICTLVIRRDILALNNRPQQRAAIHHCECKGQCIR
jgi:hypothetical protein